MVTLVCTLMWCEEPPFVLHVSGYIDVDVWKRGESVRLMVWGRTCVCEWRRASTHACVLVCVHMCVYCICVRLQLPDKSRNLRQVQSICPWFEHCTNPPPTWSFKTKPRIHSLTPIKDKENMPGPYFLYLSCESYGKNSINQIQTLSGPKQALHGTKRFCKKRLNEKPTYSVEPKEKFPMQTKEGSVFHTQHAI